MTDKLKNPELEKAALGAILINWDSDLASKLDPGDFNDHRLRAIYQAALEINERGAIPDEISLMGLLSLNKDDLNIDKTFLGDLYTITPDSFNAPEYIRQVMDLAARRRKYADGLQMINEANDPNIPTTQETERIRYTVHNAIDALTPRPPVEWIIDGLIYKKSITVIYGDGGTKKTWSTMFLAACVASGAPWGDFETRKSRVLFIDEENGEEEIAGRAAFCIRGAMADERADLFYISLAAFHLDDPKDEEILTAEILRQGAALVIMDALADIMDGDENSKQDTQPVFNALRRITEKTGAAFHVIHHANKSGGYRGNSVIKDAPDILLQVTSEPDSDLINFKTEKNRKGKPKRWTMRATWAADSFYLTSAESQFKAKVLSKSQDYVIRYLTEHGPSPLPAIMAAADTCSDNAAKFAVYSLADLAKVRRTNPGTRPAVYELTEKEN